MNNAVFGKAMENVQNRVDMKFALDEDYAVKYFYISKTAGSSMVYI